MEDVASIRHVASQLADLKWQGDEVVVVVSAMASTTDDLVKMAKDLNPDPPDRELDMLLSVGERISCALLAMAIEAEGIGAVSYTGSQVGIITDTKHGEARIVDIRPTRLLEALEDDRIVIVAGFQGVSIEKEITTLGRGGSDATAVALAAAINADRCELMKDVKGLETADPGIVENTQCIEQVDFDSALRLSMGGVAALQPEAARIAGEKEVTLAIGNTKNNTIGTIITDAPFDRGDVIGLGCQDNLLRRQGCGQLDDRNKIVRLSENRGRWILWRTPNPGEEAPLTGITIVTAGRIVEGLHEAVTLMLTDAEIATFGQIHRPGEYWVCVETVFAEKAVRLIHQVCLENGWIRQDKMGADKC